MEGAGGPADLPAWMVQQQKPWADGCVQLKLLTTAIFASLFLHSTCLFVLDKEHVFLCPAEDA